MCAASNTDGKSGSAGPEGPADDALGAPGEDRGRTDIDHDELFDLLSNRRRRFAIHYLKQRPGERVGMGELSRWVAAWEKGVEPEALDYDERKTVHNSLYQHHVPRLDDAALVDYDANRGTVRLTDAGRDVDLYLEAVTRGEVPWAAYFTLLSVLGIFAVLGAGTGFLPQVEMGAVWGVGVAVGFLVSSLVFLYDMRTRMRLGCDGPPPEVMRSGAAADADGD